MSDLSAATAALVRETNLMFTFRNELLDWAVGSASGGPKGDGTYPFTQDDGSILYVASPARISAANPNRVLIPAVVTIWAGQSNAVGSPKDRTTDYVVDQLTMAYHKVDGLRPYVPNVFAGYSLGNPTGEWAAELRYAQRFRAAYPRIPHFIVKYAMGGTMIYRSDDGQATLDWNVLSQDELYARTRTHVRDAIAAIRAAGYDPIIRMVGWVQGENDTSIPLWANAYNANLTALLRGMRDLDDGWRVGASAQIYIARLSQEFVANAMAAQANNRASIVRTAQEQVAAASPGGPTILVDTDGLSLDPADHTHYTKAGLYALGDRIADLDALGSPAQDAPGAITGLAVNSTTSTSVTLAYNAAARATSYQYRLNGAGAWEPMPNGKTIDGLAAQTNYSIQVRAMNAGGTGPESAPIAFTTENSGPTSLVKNGTFASQQNWLFLDDTKVISGGKLHFIGVGAYISVCQTDVPFAAGITYKLKFTISNYKAGSIYFGSANDANGSNQKPILIGYNADGTYETTWTPNAGNTAFFIKAFDTDQRGNTVAATMDIDDLSVIPA